MKLKTGLWIIGIVLALAFIGNLLPDNNNETTITSNVIKEEVPEENIIQEETTSEEIVEILTFEPTNDLYKVTRVIDGDTIEISTGEKVRLICIDTPELGEKGYSDATNYLKGLILNKEVELVKDISETDRYDRLLRYIYLNDVFVNERIVYYGYGKSYPYYPDTSKCPEIQNAELHAKQNDLRVWEEKKMESNEQNTGQVKEDVEETNFTITIVSSSNLISSSSPSPSSSSSCGGNIYNCGDFSTCSEVMEVFNSCSYDVNELDGDNDGTPCESLCGSKWTIHGIDD